ncbi:MAG: helix-turn-helix domain containing protein [Deltaproteobacteria bacterium]|nr:helix-turn-helix domain containing protein [Deltaproteobacteria bacterium]
MDPSRRKQPPAEPARRRGRPPIPPEQQRQRLLEAARAELRRSDFGSVRVSDVVRAAGMSSRSFYDHFQSKEDLLLALIHETGRDILVELERVFACEQDPVARVERGLGAYLAAFAGTPLDLEKLGESASGRVQKLLRHYVREVSVRVERELDREWREGVIPREPDPLVIEVLLLGLLGLASRYVAEGRADELASLQPRLSAFLRRVWA